MKKITIFANGDFPSTDISIPPNNVILAADGGARHCMKVGIIPHVVIGDFDSLTDEEITNLNVSGVQLIKHSVDKNETDLELALDYAVKIGATEITLYGLLGGRWDMTFANILLLTSPNYSHIFFRLINGNTTAHLLHGGETLKLHAQPGALVSVIPLCSAALGINYQGLQWPLENASLTWGTPRGVSNRVISTKAQISLEEGLLLVFIIDSIG